MRKMKSLKSRDVFYVAGYDPRGYRYYYSLEPLADYKKQPVI